MITWKTLSRAGISKNAVLNQRVEYRIVASTIEYYKLHITGIYNNKKFSCQVFEHPLSYIYERPFKLTEGEKHSTLKRLFKSLGRQFYLTDAPFAVFMLIIYPLIMLLVIASARPEGFPQAMECPAFSTNSI